MAIIANADIMRESLSLSWKTRESVCEGAAKSDGISHYEELYLLLFQVVLTEMV